MSSLLYKKRKKKTKPKANKQKNPEKPKQTLKRMLSVLDLSCTEHIAVKFNLPWINSFIWTFSKGTALWALSFIVKLFSN